MDKVTQGIIAGLVFGVIDILIMIPIPLPNKTTAMAASFINRFAIGFLTVNLKLPIPGWVTGVMVSLLLSLPDAIITKAYAPILGVGIIGGLIIGLLVTKL